jgi:hypothetical protein
MEFSGKYVPTANEKAVHCMCKCTYVYGTDLIWGKIKWEIYFPLPTKGFKQLSPVFLKP